MVAKTKLYIIRHCEARGNIDRIFQGHTDSDISENGLRQLERLSERFRQIKIDICYSSPLKRAVLTAEAVVKHSKAPIITDERLMEINGGLWEGVLFCNLPQKFPKEHEIWTNKPHEFLVETGERMIDVYNRMSAAIDDILESNKGKTIAVVSHGCAIRNLFCYLKGLSHEELINMKWCENTGVSIVDFDEVGRAEFELECDVSHLDKELYTMYNQDWWKESNSDSQE